MSFKSSLRKYFIITPQKIIFVAGVCLVCINFLFIGFELINARQYLFDRFNEKLSTIETSFNNEIADAKHILYGLGVTISEKSIISNQDKLAELIYNFDPRHGFDEEFSIPLADITFINEDGIESIYRMTSNAHNRTTSKDYLDVKLCLEEKDPDFFKLKISPLRIGSGRKEQIIPISMSISDSNNNYLGTLCSGLIVRELTSKLNSHFDPRYSTNIKIINRKSNLLENIEFFTLNNILKANFLNQKIIFTHELKKYPFLLEVSLKHSFLKGVIYRFILFSLSIFILLMIVVYFLSRSIRNYYENPLFSSQKQLIELNKYICNRKDSNLCIIDDRFSPSTLAELLNALISKCYPILLEQSEQTIEQNKLKRKILDLFFIEQHFMSFQKTEICEDKLYINKLYNLVSEEYVTLPLYDFLSELTNYCQEYYHEIGIKLIIEPQDRKNFTFKQTALIETIFNIFAFISRAAFVPDCSVFTIRAKFVDNGDFPTITIEANATCCLDPLGWEAGPHFVHTSLLAIYLLAKENKLLFNIVKEDDAIFFILDPIAKKIAFYELAIT